MLLRVCLGLVILFLSWFSTVPAEDIQIDPEQSVVFVDGQAHRCEQCSPLVLGHRLDINQASATELEMLPRIGVKTASAIVDLREERGGFSTLQELDDVRGIGPKTLENVKPYLRIH